MVTAKKKRKKNLAHGRPAAARKPAPSLSSKATKTLINRHHQLEKQLAGARRIGEHAEVERLMRELEGQGGLEKYQQASIAGQSALRGGDSSRVLVQWLRPCLEKRDKDASGAKAALRVLEVGALSVDNAISKCAGAEVTRIDLRSQHPQIAEQDFMAMPVPSVSEEKFDVVSLSLVVNFVPDAEARGKMLRRVGSFLRPVVEPKCAYTHSGRRELPTFLPGLFLVLPAPCIMKSRYFTEERLGQLLKLLGFSLDRRKVTAKLVYYLWRWDAPCDGGALMPKEEVNPGPQRNNFCIVLR